MRLLFSSSPTFRVSAFLLTSLPVFSAETLTLREPSDWQVFQRQTATDGLVYLAGKCASGSLIEWRLTGKPSLQEGWERVAIVEGEFSSSQKIPTGGWYRLEVRVMEGGKVAAETGVEHVGVGEVFVVAGQSNSANSGSERQKPLSGMVSSYDGTKWQIADDPQPGASGDGGSFIPAFGDALFAKFQVPVGIVAVGVGSTSVREWLPKGEPVSRLTTTGSGLKEVATSSWESIGGHFDVLSSRLTALRPHGLRAILWHQGESDAGQARNGYPAERQISGADYVRYLTILVNASRKIAGWEVPWFTAQTTYHSESDPSDDEFRAAQKEVWDSKLTLQGPDTDLLRAEYRKDVHFNAKGLQKHGELWEQKVGPWLERQLK